MGRREISNDFSPSICLEKILAVAVSSEASAAIVGLAILSDSIGCPWPLALVRAHVLSGLGMVVASSWCSSLGCLTVLWVLISPITCVTNFLYCSLSILNVQVVYITWLDSEVIVLLNI